MTGQRWIAIVLGAFLPACAQESRADRAEARVW